MNHSWRILLFAAMLVAVVVGSAGCELMPRTNLGVGVSIHDGKLKLDPHADLDIYGKP